jgi:hypothetical protein
MPRSFRSFRYRAAALALLATTAAVPFIVAPQIPAAAATARAANTGFGRATEIAQPANAASAGSSSVRNDSILIGVACSGRGYCSAGGSYTDKSGNGQAMVVTESRGKWGRGVEVKLPLNAASDPAAEVNGVACTSRGNCVAVGYYQPNPGGSGDSGFIVTEKHGAWGRAVSAAPLPSGTTASGLYAVTCPAAGSCVAAGYVIVKSGFEGLVLAQSRGRWTEHVLHAPRGGGPELAGIACTRPGYCVAVGYYFPTNLQTFSRPVAYDESKGKWGRATAVKSPKNLSGDLSGFVGDACVPSGFCLAAGYYEAGAHSYSMAASLKGGRWSATAEIDARPPHASAADVYGVSCASPRLCVAAGGYSTNPSNLLAYLVTDVSGHWKDAGGVSLPGNGAKTPRSFLYAVGCASDGYCAAVGDYAYSVTTNFAYSYPMVATRS